MDEDWKNTFGILMHGDMRWRWHGNMRWRIKFLFTESLLVCVEVLWPIQPKGAMLSMVSLPNHSFTGQT